MSHDLGVVRRKHKHELDLIDSYDKFILRLYSSKPVSPGWEMWWQGRRRHGGLALCWLPLARWTGQPGQQHCHTDWATRHRE